jgi:predicted metal-dependent hydrolase
MIYHDEIIEEVWNNRQAHATQHHHNLHKIVADLKKRYPLFFNSGR